MELFGLASENETTDEQASSMLLAMLCVCIILMALTIYCMVFLKISWIPESIVTICLGAIGGLVMKLSSAYFELGIESLSEFDPEVFFLFLLPPIIFEGGYSLNKSHFFRNIFTICLYAYIGTVISALFTGIGLWTLGYFGIIYEASFLDNLTFGSLISAVDPVATLAIFNALDVSPMLYMMVFGESILNDAVSVVLFRTLLSFKDAEVTPLSILLLPLQFAWINVGSIALGIICGLVTAMMFKLLELQFHRTLEIVLLLAASYMAYFISEAFHLSGIMTILSVGVIAQHYTSYSLSPSSSDAITELTHAVSFAAENAVFAYLGASIFSVSHSVKFSYIIATIALIIIGRALNIFPLTVIANRFRMYEVPFVFGVLQWFSGLRGAVAFALALTLTGSAGTIIMTTTLVVVLFTIVVFGGSTLPMMKLLRVNTIKVKPSKKFGQNYISKVCSNKVGHLLAEMGVFSEETREDVIAHFARKNWVEKLDEIYMQPTFRKTGVPLVQTLADHKIRIVSFITKKPLPERLQTLTEARMQDEINATVGRIIIETQVNRSTKPMGKTALTVTGVDTRGMTASIPPDESDVEGGPITPRARETLVQDPTAPGHMLDQAATSGATLPGVDGRARALSMRHTPMLARRNMAPRHSLDRARPSQSVRGPLPVGMHIHTSKAKKHHHRHDSAAPTAQMTPIPETATIADIPSRQSQSSIPRVSSRIENLVHDESPEHSPVGSSKVEKGPNWLGDESKVVSRYNTDDDGDSGSEAHSETDAHEMVTVLKIGMSRPSNLALDSEGKSSRSMSYAGDSSSDEESQPGEIRAQSLTTTAVPTPVYSEAGSDADYSEGTDNANMTSSDSSDDGFGADFRL
ncbi:Na /H exchanger [Carpediemonas membranifera]|uniref:Sodium/hydrogen exchanger n=1 Tax=Carpediemonas membranifera TaxID=201153 RepID=A0A8J6AWP2_9EUKA|nr:Na /H exchanger [Carpediemonas membranifera]|eukprot:KAG9393450.1 Na /H exchanger [Carpediemonas membranifera]